MKPYTIIVNMNNGDVVIWHGWADSAVQARELIGATHEGNGWMKDVVNVVVHNNRDRKHAGFTLLTQIAVRR